MFVISIAIMLVMGMGSNALFANTVSSELELLVRELDKGIRSLV